MKKFSLVFCVVLMGILLLTAGCQPGIFSPTPTATELQNQTGEIQVTTPMNVVVDETVPPVDLTVSPSASASASASASPSASPSPTPTKAPTKPPAERQADDSTKIGPTKPINVPSKDYPFKYYLEVDLTNQCVNVYNLYTSTMAADGSIVTTRFDQPQLVDRFICSSGLGSSTPTGVYYVPKPGAKGYGTTKFSWGYFNKFDCWARYLTRIDGGILFHSIIFSKQSMSTARTSSYYNLGNKASHGCIRLTVEHAKWIYDNCDIGTMVSITNKQPKSKELKNYLKDHLPKYGVTITERPEMGATVNAVVTPTLQPTATAKPTATKKVTAAPTKTPTKKPTATPTKTPTKAPTATPTVTPTKTVPASVYTPNPTAADVETPEG